MPMLDAYIPAGSLAPTDETTLMARLTDLLLRHEGADPNNPAARSLAWVFLHRPVEVYVGGKETTTPYYRFVISVPEGQIDPQRRAAMVASITEAVLDAENGAHPRQPERVWVFTSEVPEKTWGHGGRIYGLADIAGYVLGDGAKGKEYAEKIWAARKRSNATATGGETDGRS